MAIVRWEPFRDLVTIQDRLNRVFDEAFRRHAHRRGRVGARRQLGAAGRHLRAGRQPRLKAELPGIEPKDVDIRVENNVLTLRGERKFDQEVKRENCHRVERAYGTFSRAFTLPNVVDTASIKAEFKDGVLHITMPKR